MCAFAIAVAPDNDTGLGALGYRRPAGTGLERLSGTLSHRAHLPVPRLSESERRRASVCVSSKVAGGQTVLSIPFGDAV